MTSNTDPLEPYTIQGITQNRWIWLCTGGIIGLFLSVFSLLSITDIIQRQREADFFTRTLTSHWEDPDFYASIAILVIGQLIIAGGIWLATLTPRYITFYPGRFEWGGLLRKRTAEIDHFKRIRSEPIVQAVQNQSKQIIRFRMSLERSRQTALSIAEGRYKGLTFRTIHDIGKVWGWRAEFEKRYTHLHHRTVGSHRPFEWYFEQESQVDVQSIDDIVEWLRGCTYMYDRIQFGYGDFWLHPVTFERMKTGDCEDHALWAWRKLVNLGYKATYVVDEKHAWLEFIDKHDGDLYVLESTAKRELIHRAADVRDKYAPMMGVDEKFHTYLYHWDYHPPAPEDQTDSPHV